MTAIFVETFNKGSPVATVNFSVPDDINARFSATFKGRNKSAILSRLMEQAVEQEEQRLRKVKAIDGLLALRAAAGKKSTGKTARTTDAAIRKARRLGRP